MNMGKENKFKGATAFRFTLPHKNKKEGIPMPKETETGPNGTGPRGLGQSRGGRGGGFAAGLRAHVYAPNAGRNFPHDGCTLCDHAVPQVRYSHDARPVRRD
jgi:hypothetical protein